MDRLDVIQLTCPTDGHSTLTVDTHHDSPWANVIMSAEGSRKPQVVVVGGQFAGRRAAKLLRRGGRFGVTLVDAKSFWEYTPGALRCLVEPRATRRLLQPHPPGTVNATAVAFEKTKTQEGDAVKGVKLNDGSNLRADYVVLATGSSYVSPIKAASDKPCSVEDRKKIIMAAHKKLASAPSVLIVGGGTVGVELAAEIVGVWGKSKNVTIITPHSRLLERMPPRAGMLAQRWLTKKGVRVILNDRIEDWGGSKTGGDPALKPSGGTWKLQTRGGEELHASLVYPCIGGAPAAGPADKSTLGSRGEVNVDDSFRVEGLRNVFAVGDCAGTAEEKTAFTADLNATAVAHNIRAAHNGKRVKEYPKVCGAQSVPSIAVVSLYKWSAVMQFNKLVFGGPVPALVKWFIETMQVHAAKETPVLTELWDVVEQTNVFLGGFMFK